MPPKALPYHPKQGEVLRCDYGGLVPPEMDKRRWVVVLSPKFVGRRELCTVVPLSTTPPPRIEDYHVLLDRDPAPDSCGLPVWAKCDMLMTVSFARLSAWAERGDDGRRKYLQLFVSGAELGKIRRATLAALGLEHLWR
ncbi:MAG TPA: type II toxin-antitoxin system PemK/MazF family toxin [Planctomycetota bacterium]|nr:type II toxin-antitoxin system PemK/MazF family toxin [Planctomycetota bacterium]